MAEFRILIADDDEDDFFLMESAFKESGQKHRIDHVKDGQLLLEYLYDAVKNNEPYPDLIVLDINMPIMDGLRALELLKSNDIFSSIPVVMCSTASDPDIMYRCHVNGAKGYISKAAGYGKVVETAVALNAYLNELKLRPDAYFNFKEELLANKHYDL